MDAVPAHENMPTSVPPNSPIEVEQLLLNARLRDQLEPYVDESFNLLDTGRWTTAQENDFLESLLEWERAPIVPISRWFDPELAPPAHETLSDDKLHEQLWRLIDQLAARNVVLECTDHLSDRQLYCLLVRDVLTSGEKLITRRATPLNWRFIDELEHPDVWLRYYASADERAEWEAETGEIPPPSEQPPYSRDLPTGRSAGR